MTLLETIRMMETVALGQAAIETVVENDVFRLNNMPAVKYGVFAFTQGQHSSTTEEAFTSYRFTLFYIDRLDENRSNQIQIQSTGERTLRNILLVLAEQGIEVGSYTLQPFNQKFADECAGVYCEVGLSVPNEGTCPDWVPDLGGDIVTPAMLEQKLTQSTIRTDMAQSLSAAAQKQAQANIGLSGAVPLVEQVAGSDVELAVVGNTEYVCGELASLTIMSVEDSAGVSVVRFRSGAAPTQLTLPADVPVAGWRVPQPKRTYDLYFRSGAATIVWYE